MARLTLTMLVAALTVPALCAQTPSSTPDALAAFGRADGFALQGEIRQALAALRSVPASEFSPGAARTRSCILDRFERRQDPVPATGLPKTASRTLSLYHAYWRAALLQPSRRDAEEERLRRSLTKLLGLPAASDMTAVETRLAERLAREGVQALTGRTPPLREFMLWRRQRAEQRDVALPEGSHSVRVVFLGDFDSLGWSAYATCDRRLSAGWVRPDGIYVVTPAWGDLNAEGFQVSFLGHETQHFRRQGAVR